ncbi:hypothetical protein D8674_025827 [Pyrus ussuriensis x Pyrus communis]|uniref:Uncharacterized protein n=1 Tax=Pyrus ussuriensis x Pyrus communis TaxID=2448454 RepID=A0A5N5I821_9ROSA|nr:hypothetical protein D8674_025827 [Pyrus ussuriensis x Pyrus communis]
MTESIDLPCNKNERGRSNDRYSKPYMPITRKLVVYIGHGRSPLEKKWPAFGMFLESLEDICSPFSSNLLHLAHAKDRLSLLSSSSPCRTNKCGLFSLEKVKKIKTDSLAHLIAIVEPTVNKGGKKRSSPSAQEMLVKKKLKTSSIAREGPPVIERSVIDMTSSNGKKNKAARSEPVAPAMLRMANSIVDKRLAIMKSDKVDFAAKVALRPTPSAAETDSPVGKEETTHVGSFEKSIKPASRKAAEICVFLKPDLLEDMDICAKLVDGVKKLETACQEIVVLKTRLDAIRVKYESAEKEIGCYIPLIQDLEFAVSELYFVVFAKHEELIAAYNQVINFKRIVDKLESQVLKKEVDELQRICVGLLEKNEQLQGEKDELKARAAGGEVLEDAADKSVAVAQGVTTK